MKTQHEMQRSAQQRTFTQNRVFIEIQQGPNPLTNAEIDRLADERPATWGRFRGMGIDAKAGGAK